MEALKEVPFIKEWIIEGEEKGEEKGIKEGIKEGKRTAILNLLEIRFKRVPKGLKQKINKIDNVETLDRLFKEAATSDSLVEFEKVF
jgi:predicted transposase YdaD